MAYIIISLWYNTQDPLSGIEYHPSDYKIKNTVQLMQIVSLIAKLCVAQNNNALLSILMITQNGVLSAV